MQKIAKILRNKQSIVVPNAAISNPGSGQITPARQPLLSRESASRNQQNKAINCNFRQASSKHLITLEPFLLKIIIIKNLVGERLAWALAHGASKGR